MNTHGIHIAWRGDSLGPRSDSGGNHSLVLALDEDSEDTVLLGTVSGKQVAKEIVRDQKGISNPDRLPIVGTVDMVLARYAARFMRFGRRKGHH